jgi:hypothetical protein
MVEVRFDDWLKKFSALHEKARGGKLSTLDNRTYLGARNELARAMLKKHRQKVPEGAKARQLLRAPAAIPVDLHLPGTVAHALTQELWTGGFSALVPPLGMPVERLKFALTVTKDAPPIEGWVRVVSDAAAGGSTRLTLEFEGLSPADAERVEFAVFDSVLTRLGPPGTAR